MGEYVSDKHMTPQFPVNRDLSDVAYDEGFWIGKQGLPFCEDDVERYQRPSQQRAFENGYKAGRRTLQPATGTDA